MSDDALTEAQREVDALLPGTAPIAPQLRISSINDGATYVRNGEEVRGRLHWGWLDPVRIDCDPTWRPGTLAAALISFGMFYRRVADLRLEDANPVRPGLTAWVSASGNCRERYASARRSGGGR